MRKRAVSLMVILALVLSIAACAGTQTVKPYAVVKASAEGILYDARIMQNKGQLSDADFQTVKDMYNKVKAGQDAVIDARLALIQVNTADNQNKLNVALAQVVTLLGQLQALATDVGIRGLK